MHSIAMVVLLYLRDCWSRQTTPGMVVYRDQRLDSVVRITCTVRTRPCRVWSGPSPGLGPGTTGCPFWLP